MIWNKKKQGEDLSQFFLKKIIEIIYHLSQNKWKSQNTKINDICQPELSANINSIVVIRFD